jgi:transcriptional regulator GlxA family with amidase domain
MAAAIIDEVERAGVDATGETRVAKPSQCGKLPNRLLQRVLERMKADLGTDLDLSTLAAESGYRSHFLRTFRVAMGCSPHQYVTRLRVEQAKTLLREESISLIDVALTRLRTSKAREAQETHWRHFCWEFPTADKGGTRL